MATAAKVVFLLATVEDRIGLASKFIESAKKYRPDWPIYVVAQGYSDNSRRIMMQHGTQVKARYLQRRVGPHAAKAVGLVWIKSELEGPFVVCSVDDDMELTPQTNYDPVVAKCQEPGVGLVSAGWAPNETRLATWPVVDDYIKQPIVYTGGGLFFNKNIADILLSLPPLADYWCDNSEWSLATYLSGYENYRYRGSVTLHRVCRRGGRRAWVDEGHGRLPDSRYLIVKRGAREGEYHVGSTSDLTLLARRTHINAKERLCV